MPGRSLFGPLRFREHPGGVPTTSGAGVPILSGAPTGDDDSGAGVVGPRLEENRSSDRRHDWRRRRYRRDLRRQEGRAYWSGDRRRGELDLRSAEALAARSRLANVEPETRAPSHNLYHGGHGNQRRTRSEENLFVKP